MVSFTGGYDTGIAIQAKAGMKKMALELGSNSPVIVMPDADLDSAVADIVSGAFWAAGQNCLHVQRILIHADIYDRVRDELVKQSRAYRVGDKLDPMTQMGPCISAAHAEKVESLVREARDAGATVLCGGERVGNYYLPTLLENVPATARLHKEEVFGPVSLLYRFNTAEEAIHLANDTDFGLQAGIFTRDVNTAWKLADGLDCGGVIINDSGDYRIDAMPFGGTRRSGLGREGIKFALQDMTEPKMYCFNLS
jgi:glyceraldehyde-3-phosphate dehydrogenase (NADP+)